MPIFRVRMFHNLGASSVRPLQKRGTAARAAASPHDHSAVRWEETGPGLPLQRARCRRRRRSGYAPGRAPQGAMIPCCESTVNSIAFQEPDAAHGAVAAPPAVARSGTERGGQVGAWELPPREVRHPSDLLSSTRHVHSLDQPISGWSAWSSARRRRRVTGRAPRPDPRREGFRVRPPARDRHRRLRYRSSPAHRGPLPRPSPPEPPGW